MPRINVAAPTPERAHIYCRVSSARQEDGSSLDTQEAACRAYAKEHGWIVASATREVWSGADRHRPELDALRDRLLPGDVVLCYALDRLSRTQDDIPILIALIEDRGVTVDFVTEDFEKSAVGTFLRGAKAFAAEIELEKIRERTQRGRRARVASGKPIAGGKPRYGFRWVDPEKKKGGKTRLELDPDTAPVVRMIFDWALDGVTLRGIATRLQARGIRAPTGNAHWRPAGIRDLLLCPTYTGDAVAYRWRFERKPGGGYTPRPGNAADMVTLPGIAPAIVTAEEQASVAARLERNKANAHRNNPTPELALLRTGFIRCGHCGRSLGVRNPRKDRPNSAASYQKCQSPGCQRPSIATSLIDEAVWSRVCQVLRAPGIIAAELDNHRNEGGLARDLAAIDTRIESITTKQTTLARRVAMLSDNAAEPVLAELELLATAKKTMETDRADLVRRMADVDADRARMRSISDWCEIVGANLDTLTYDEKRLALEALGVSVRIYRTGATDEGGIPLPRWEITVRPLALSDPIVYARANSAGSRRIR